MPATSNVPAENINLAQVGNGYIELRNHRFAAVYKVSRGINPTVEENDEIYKRLSVFENALRQLAPNEEVQIIFKRVPANSGLLVEQFNKYASDKTPAILQDKFYSYYRNWLDDFTNGRYSGKQLFSYEVYVLFSIDFKLRPLTEQAFGVLNKVFSVFNKETAGEKVEDTKVLATQLEETLRRAKAWIGNVAVAGVEGRILNKSEIYRLLY